MIEVTLVETGDWAEADSVGAAVLAARTLRADAVAASGGSGSRYSARFVVDGVTVGVGLVRDLLTKEAG